MLRKTEAFSVGTKALKARRSTISLKVYHPKKSEGYEYIGKSADTVGGQIFYDAIGIIFGGNPEKAVQYAKITASVIHNGEGAIGGAFLSACISAAFCENDIEKIIQTAIPEDSEYAGMVRNIVDFHSKVPYEWTAGQHYIEDNYNKHYVWDYGSHIIMALLCGNDNFSYSMEICLKLGGDTDCNCGNLGAILVALNSYEKIPSDNWIKPMNDVLYCSGTVPCENEVSITQFTAYMIKLFAKFNNSDIPEYIERASRLNNFMLAFENSYQKMEASLWRNGTERTDLVNSSNLWVSSGEVKNLSGSPYTLKVWADKVKHGDCLRVYRWFNLGNFDNIKYEPISCTKIYPRQKVKVNVMTRYNTACMKVRIIAYSLFEDKAGCSTNSCSPYIYIKSGKWYTLELVIDEIPSFYNCINVEMIVTQDSYYENEYDGIDLYIDDLHIKGNPHYTTDFSLTRGILNNENHYPILQNFSVCYGEAYEDSGNDYGYIRFYSGYFVSCLKGKHFQQLAYENNLAMAFSVRGAVEHFAVGFHNGKMAVLESAGMPGKYNELVSEYYSYDIKKFYHFEVQVRKGKISFIVCEINSTDKNDILWETKKVLTYNTEYYIPDDCIGFVGIGNCITVYEYGII